MLWHLLNKFGALSICEQLAVFEVNASQKEAQGNIHYSKTDNIGIHLSICLRRNILPEMKDTDLKGCIYNRNKNPYCPIFRLGDIVSEAKENFTEMAVEVNAFRSKHTKIYTNVKKN